MSNKEKRQLKLVTPPHLPLLKKRFWLLGILDQLETCHTEAALTKICVCDGHGGCQHEDDQRALRWLRSQPARKSTTLHLRGRFEAQLSTEANLTREASLLALMTQNLGKREESATLVGLMGRSPWSKFSSEPVWSSEDQTAASAHQNQRCLHSCYSRLTKSAQRAAIMGITRVNFQQMYLS